MPIVAAVRLEPLFELVGNRDLREEVATIKLGRRRKVTDPALLDQVIEDPKVGLAGAGGKSDGLKVGLDLDRCAVTGRESAPDIDERLAQAVARLRLATARPEAIGEQGPAHAATPRQHQGGKNERGLARREPDRFVRRRNDGELPQQSNAHALAPFHKMRATLALIAFDLTQI